MVGFDTSGTMLCSAGNVSTPCEEGEAGVACEIKITEQGFVLVYSLDIPLVANWDQLSDVPYTVDNTASLVGQTIQRIGYLLELDDTYIWVTMNDFTESSDFSRLGIPTDWIWDKEVEALTVLTNVPNVNAVTLASGGNIEFWSHSYFSGPDGSFNANDSISRPDDYGSFQIHHNGDTLLAYNGWSYTASGENDNFRFGDVGIGNSLIFNRTDWTTINNAGDYTTRRLQVYVLLE